MSDIILSVKNLDKSMGGRKIIDSVSFDTYAGEVFGFLGPNGAGKTTTIKMILGLLDPDGGEILINGVDIRKNFEKAMETVGGIIENPDTYKYLTAEQNLRQYKRMRRGVTDERVTEVLQTVGLEKRKKDKVKKYSLGMKQRLGLAQTLLHRPKLLVLDEPTNGLDPAGIKDLRDILKKLAHEEGCAVMVSSHLLSEMELMCDRVGIIANGRVISVQTTQELMAHTSGTGKKLYKITVGDAEKAKPFIGEYVDLDQNVFTVAVDDEAAVGVITAALVTNGVMLLGAAPVEKSLEDAFIEITDKGGNQIA